MLAKCGFGSRRACEEFISEGRVKVDGEIVQLGCNVTRDSVVVVDDEPIRPDKRVYYMVNKPKGMLCTNSDPNGRPRIIDLFPGGAGRLFPIGRLDENTVGLIIVTNDGELSHQLAHPKFEVPKIYRVQVAGVPDSETLKKMRQGMYFSDGKFKVEHVRRITSHGKSAILEVTLREGQNREVRRLFARVGHKVMKLERVTFGPLHLRRVASGEVRALTKDEVKLLRGYVDNHESRIAEERKNSHRKPPEKKTRKRAQRKTVEVAPVEGMGSYDLIGQRRNPRPKKTYPQRDAEADAAVTDDKRSKPATDNKRSKSAKSSKTNETVGVKSTHPAVVKSRRRQS